MDLQPFKKATEDDYIEPEIVSGPGSGGDTGDRNGHRSGNRHKRSENYGPPPHERSGIPFYGLFLRLKVIFITGILLVSFALIVLGLVLTSTVIGAVIGIPLLLLGGFLLWLLFKLLTFGQKTRPIVFRRF